MRGIPAAGAAGKGAQSRFPRGGWRRGAAERRPVPKNVSDLQKTLRSAPATPPGLRAPALRQKTCAQIKLDSSIFRQKKRIGHNIGHTFYHQGTVWAYGAKINSVN